jgi:hypothetical protein
VIRTVFLSRTQDLTLKNKRGLAITAKQSHKKIEQATFYIKVTTDDNAKRLANHPFFKDNKTPAPNK